MPRRSSTNNSNNPATAAAPARVSQQRLIKAFLLVAMAVIVGMQLYVGHFMTRPVDLTAAAAAAAAGSSSSSSEEDALPPNYYLDATASTTNASLFLPERILEAYVRRHGVEALRRNPHGRRYCIAYYNCPHRAGNAVHSFLNALIWCVATNRTALWRYDAVPARNSVTDCDPVLERAPWLASYDEWSVRLELPKWSYVHMNTRENAAHAQKYGGLLRTYTAQEQRDSLQVPVAVFPRFKDWPAVTDLDVSRVHWNDDPASLTVDCPWYRRWWYQRSPFLEDALATNTMQLLYARGRDFLYGMLFRRAFRILVAPRNVPEPAYNSSSSSSENAENAPITIGLHSRHAHRHLDGTDVHQEINCLAQLIPPNHHHAQQRECYVYLMSDRQTTLDLIGAWLQTERPHCRNITVTDKQGDTQWGFRPEMGAFAGAAFLSDAAMVSEHARTGLVGNPVRSSTQLVLDLVAYNRQDEYRNRFGREAAERNLPDLQLCTYWRPR